MLRKLFTTIVALSILLSTASGTAFALSFESQDPLLPQTSTSTIVFDVWRDGTSSTYHADSPGASFTGSLKFVVESAVEELKAVGGGSVIFRAGDFDLGSTWFEIKDALFIIFAGQGIDATVLSNYTTIAADTEPFDMTRSDNITIQDMTISAGGPERTTSDAIDFDGGDDNIVQRVKVISARGRGIIFDGKDSVSATGGTADRNVVRDCIVTGTNRDGIQLLASNDNLIENCHIYDVAGDGIRVHKASSSAAQPNKPSNDNIIRNNLIENAGTHGIRVHAGNRNVIAYNTVLNSSDDASGQDGIHIESSNSLSCDDNIVQLNTATDNQAVKTQAYGLHIDDPECHRTVVSDNNFTGNLIGEIRDDGTGTIYTSSDTEAPTAPTDLVALDIQATEVSLNWSASDDNVGVVAYDIFRDGGMIDSVGATPGYVDGAVAGDTAYQYEIRARDAAGNVSAFSNTLDVTTPPPPPPPPILTFTPTDDAYVKESKPTTNYNSSTINVDASSRKDGLIQFDVSGIDGRTVVNVTLRLYVTNRSPKGGDFFEMTNTAWNENTVTWATVPPADGGLLASLGSVIQGNWYEIDVTQLVSGDGPVSIRITSDNSDGADYASKENSNGNAPELIVELEAVPDTEPPTAPTNLVATDIQETAVTLSWIAASDDVAVVAYDIYRDGAIIDSVGATPGYVDSTVAADTGYQYEVRARDAAGNVSDPSNTLDVTTPAPDTEQPSAPTDLVATDVQANQITLDWTASSDNIGVVAYDIYRDGGLIDSVGASPGYIDSTVTADTDYQYEVRARDAAGNVSAPSNLLEVTTPPAPDTEPPSAPTNLIATEVQPNQVSLDWTASSDNNGVVAYDIYRDGGLIDSVGASPGYIDSTVAADTSYQYEVRARDTAGNVSDPSNTLDVTTPAAPDTEPPSAPTNLIASDVQSNQVTLSWTASGDNIGVIAYDIYRDGGLIDSVGATPGYVDSTVIADASYQYEVRARDAAGNVSAPSNTLDVTTPPAPSVLTFTPTDDAYIKESSPTTNYNTSTVNVDASSKKDGLLRFDVSGIGTRTVVSVKLRLYVTDPSSTGGDFYKMLDTNWSENTVTWATAPLGDGGLLGALGPVAAGNWYEIDVTALLSGDGVVSLRISSNDTNGADYASKENSNGFAPELIIVVE